MTTMHYAPHGGAASEVDLKGGVMISFSWIPSKLNFKILLLLTWFLQLILSALVVILH